MTVESAGEGMRAEAGVAAVDAAVVLLEGTDARRFANGMFTQNVRDLAAGQGKRSGWADDRGRLLGLMDLLALGPDAFLLVLDTPTSEGFRERFERFVVFDDVEIRDLDRAVLTVQGPRAEEVVRAAGLEVPAGAFSGGPEGVLVHRRDRTGLGGFDLLLPPAERGAREAGLRAAGALAATAADLELLRVEAGLIRLDQDVPDKAFAHELGLRETILDFEKGCYVGQEIINRMDTRANVRRALVGLAFEAELPAAGAALLGEGKKVGKVTSPTSSPRFGPIGLAVVRKPWDAPGAVLRVEGGGTATVQALPFGS